MAHRQWPKQHRIHQAEERRVGSNGERQRDNRGRGETRILRQHSQTEFDVLPERAHASSLHNHCIASTE
jgi:hypothetical protein